MDARPSRSRRQSATNPPPERPTFFLDRSIQSRLVYQALLDAGEDVRLHRDFSQHDAKDEDWLTEVGRNEWVVLRRDQMIHHRPLERTALINVRAFVLTSGNLTGREMAQIIIQALPKVYHILANHSPPFIARITRDGRVEVITRQ